MQKCILNNVHEKRDSINIVCYIIYQFYETYWRHKFLDLMHLKICRPIFKYLIIFRNTIISEYCSTTLPVRGKMQNVELLQNITGRSPQHLNDVLYVEPENCDTKGNNCDQSRTDKNRILVYFGGDVQDLSSNMKLHRDNQKYLRWSLEETASLLSRSYPDNYIMVVRPNRMERSTFSCFDNFVESNSCGAPTHLTHKTVAEINSNSLCYALLQLKGLVYSVMRLKGLLENEMSPLKLTLVGFSKGVVVLNQILHDLHILNSVQHEGESKMKDDLSRFSDKIERMIWLDGGHNGGKDTWITDEEVLKTLATKTNINIEVKVTPYQVQDNRRPWIGKEEKRFRNILGNKFDLISSKRLIRSLHFAEEEANIENHFKILTTLSCDI